MLFRTAFVILGCACALFAVDKRLPIERTSNDLVEITATVYLDEAEIHSLIGYDLPEGIVVVKTEVRPVSDTPVRIDRDDFYLLSDKDGQRSQPFEPSQIAGANRMVVRSVAGPAGGYTRSNGPIWGGIPGTMGGPQQMPGNGGAGGNGGATTTQADAKIEQGQPDKPNPLLDALKQKILPEKAVTEPVAGLLYFQMDGKLKTKNLELHYKSASGKIALRFRP